MRYAPSKSQKILWAKGGFMSQKINGISNPKISLNILSDEDVRQIHTATLDVIETVGVRFPSQKALDIFAAHGAVVDRATQIVRIPGATIEEYMAKAPPTYTLAAMDPDLDLPLDGNHSFLGTDGCGVEIIDAFTGEKRRSTKQDIADIARLSDKLEAIAFHWVPLSAQDCPPQSRSLHELDAIWSSSRKHVQTEAIVNEREMHYAVEIAELLAGGKEALRKRPILSIMQCTYSPLAQDGGSLEAGLVAAEAGLPVGYMTMSSCASNAPATLAGNLVVGNAEVISALTLMQMAYPGCPVYYAAAQTVMDLRTGAYTGGGPEDYLFGAATNRLADYYKVPLSMGAFATGAKEPGWQSALDDSFSSFMAVATLSDMLLGAGLLYGSRIFSYEEMLLSSEIWSMLAAMFRGIEVNPETLALDTIRAVGPGGSYLTQKHTIKNMRQLWQPTFIDRRPYSIWEEKRDGSRQWALQKAQQILKEYDPQPLDGKTKAEISKIIAGVEAESGVS
jgi:trimethylamine---corrinoid protein Co-methyltransferase